MPNWLARYGSARLPPAQEQAFQRDMQFGPGWSNWRRDFINNVGQQPNTDPGGDYNYRAAWLAGARPEYHAPSNSYHGMSSAMVPPYKDPVNFKSPDHPTMWKEKFMRQYGFDPDAPNAPWTEESVVGLLGFLE
tara:strand:+ start:1399 stop:1800 length:402 start_codon:yes stop_codon:yes gene_type:complete